MRQYVDALLLSSESAIGIYGNKALSVLKWPVIAWSYGVALKTSNVSSSCANSSHCLIALLSRYALLLKLVFQTTLIKKYISLMGLYVFVLLLFYVYLFHCNNLFIGYILGTFKVFLFFNIRVRIGQFFLSRAGYLKHS